MNNLLRNGLLVLTAILSTAVSAANSPTLRVEGPWARETAQGQSNGGAFVTFVNDSDQADSLVSASSPAAGEVQIHTMALDNGVMRMRQLPEGIAVPAKGRVELKPRSLHLMFIGLRGPLKIGTTVPVTLVFSKSGARTVEFAVKPATAMSP